MLEPAGERPKGSRATGGRSRADSPPAGSWLTGQRVRVHAALLAVCLWSFYAFSVATPGLRDRSGLLKGADFLQFYVFGSLARAGGPESLYDFEAHVARARQLVPESEGVSFLPIYGPQLAALFRPLAGLPYGSALALWTGLSVLLYALCVVAVWRTCPRLAGRGPVVALLAVACPPFFAMVGYGQISALALVCTTAAWLALRADRPWLAGLAIGSLAYKPQLGLAAAVVFVVSREWRVVLAAIAAGLLQLALGWLAFGSGVLEDYVRVVASLAELAPVLGFKLHQMHSLRSFFDPLLPRAPALIAYALGSAAILILAVRGWRSRAPLALRFGSLLFATALVNPHQYMYDLVILVPAWLLLADWALAHPGDPSARALCLPLYASFLLPALGPLSRLTHLQLSVPALVLVALVLDRAMREQGMQPAIASGPIETGRDATAALG